MRSAYLTAIIVSFGETNYDNGEVIKPPAYIYYNMVVLALHM